MPHRVPNIFRSSAENVATTAIKSTSPQGRDSNSRSRIRRLREAGRAYSYASSLSDDDGDPSPPVRMSDAESTHSGSNVVSSIKKHRLALHFGRAGKESHESAQAHLDWKVESPPIVFYGDAESSTGALLSGQLFLTVRVETLALESLEAAARIHVTQKRPFANHCSECAHQYTELKTWRFLAQPKTLPRGTHQFPFSVLLDGHLPASMDTPLMSISYEFKAEAVVARPPNSPATAAAGVLKLERTLDVWRSLPEPDLPHHSVRVFPPTNIKASAHYAEVIRPTGAHTMSLRLDGLSTTNHANSTVELWKLRKVAWKLEEHLKTVAPACQKHDPPATPAAAADGAAARKGLNREETRVLGEKVMYEGWKSDYQSGAGTVDFEFDYGVRAAGPHHGLGHHGHHNSPRRYACASKSRDGTQVSHTLMVELVVSHEWTPINKPSLVTQTGTGRILRMHYAVSLSESPGQGVSWDNEAPPVYADVPPSPPAYPEEPPIHYENLEMLEAERSSVEGREDSPRV